MTFAELKNKKTKSMDKLLEALDSEDKKSYGDDRFWKLTVDEKTGNGYAIIRFLPPPENNTKPFVLYYKHGFQGPTGKWYFEWSRTSLVIDGKAEKDPVSEENTKLWNSGQQDLARDRKRRKCYVSNIFVVDDPKNPENNGKVFLFEYGPKIFDKIKSAIKPEFDSEEGFDPTDFWTGANFKLVAKQVHGQRSYDSSVFLERGKLLDSDEDMEAVWKKEYDLNEFVDPKNYKSYNELKRKLFDVLGKDVPDVGSDGETNLPRRKDEEDDDDVPWNSGSESKGNDDEDDDDLDIEKMLKELG